MRILIIDECARDRRLIKEAVSQALPRISFLEPAGRYEITETLASGDFDAVLMDYRLSWTDGLTLLRMLKHRRPAVPVIFVTDERSERIAVQGVKAGLSDYVLKQEAVRRLPEALLNSLAEAQTSLPPADEGLWQVSGAASDDANFLRAVADQMPSAWYVFDLSEQRHVWANRQFGLMAGSLPTVLDGMGAVEQDLRLHPDDMETLAGRKERLGRARDGEIITTEYRVRGACGEWRWFHSRELVFARDPEGAPRQVLGSAQDITEHKSIEESLQQARARTEALTVEHLGRYQQAREQMALYQRVLDMLPDGVALLDPAEQRVSWANRAYWQGLGQSRPAGEMAGDEHLAHFADFFEAFDADGRSLPAEQSPVALALVGVTFREKSVTLRRRAGGRTWQATFTSELLKHGAEQRPLMLLTVRTETVGRPAQVQPAAVRVPVRHFSADIADLSGPKPELREIWEELRRENQAGEDFVLPRLSTEDLMAWQVVYRDGEDGDNATAV